MCSPLVFQVASLLSATISPDLPPLFAQAASNSWLPAGVLWIVATVVLVIAVCELFGLRTLPTTGSASSKNSGR